METHPQDIPFPEQLGRLAVIPLGAAIIVTALAAFAGYAISRAYIHRRSHSGAGTVLLGGNLLAVPIYVAAAVWLGESSSALALVVIYGLISLPFCTWILKIAADAVRPQMLDAARLDGCSPVECIRLVVLPLLARALIASAIFSFVMAWDLNIIYTLHVTAARTWIGLLLTIPLVMLFVIVGVRVGHRDTAPAA